MADVFACSIRRNAGLAVQEVLNLVEHLVLHLFALVVYQFDTIIIERIMAGRDHDAAIKGVSFGDIGYRRCSCYVQQIGICSGRSYTGCKGILQHIG